MMNDILEITGALVVLAALFGLAQAGFRHGDRATDALVTAVLSPAGEPGKCRLVVIATVRNPAASPVLAGLAVRRAWWPALLAGPQDSRVPRWTGRRAFRADGYPTVAVVAAGAAADLVVPVTTMARRYRLTVAVGQADKRLRVHRVRLDARRPSGVRLTRAAGSLLS